MDSHQETLKNGLNVLWIDAPGSTCASTQIWFRAGSALEKKKDWGVAHFLEHMFFKGTPKRPGSKIAFDVESFGGELNAFTSFDYTCYYINSPAKNLKNSVDILMDMVSNPQFLLEDLIPEREVVWEEYKRSADSPRHFNFQSVQKSFFPKGYEHPILGEKKTILNFSQKQLKDFRERHYNRNNALLVVAGDLKKQKKSLEKLINHYSLPKGPKTAFPQFKLKSPGSEIHEHDISNARVTITFQAPQYDQKESAHEDLALSALSHGETSPLFKEMVLKDSLATTISASSMFMNNGGVHFMSLACPVENLEKVLSRLKTAIGDCVSRGIEVKDMKKMKSLFLSGKIYEKETIESYAFSLGHGFAQNENIHCEEAFLENIKKCSTQELNQSLRRIFQKDAHVQLQLPRGHKFSKSKLERFRKSLKKKSTGDKRPKLNQSQNDPELKSIELSKGVKLLYRYNPIAPTYSLHTYIKGGLSDEKPQTSGLYHLLATLLNKGYPGKSREDIKRIFEECSSSLATFSGKNAYGLTSHGLSEHFDKLATEYFNCLFQAEFPKERLDHEVAIIKRALKERKNDPAKMMFEKISQTLFKDHHYSLQTLGTPKTIARLNSKKLRDKHTENLASKEILVTYVGSHSLEEVLSIVSAKINFPNRKVKKSPLKKAQQSTQKEIHLNFKKEQTHLFAAIPTPGFNDSLHHSLKIITSYLSGQSSPLFVEMRDRRGLCYVAQPLHFQALEAGYWGIYMASGNEKCPEAKEAIFSLLNDLSENSLPKKEFLRVKKMILGQTSMAMQTCEDMANTHSVPFLHGGKIDHYFESNKSVQELSYEKFKKDLKNLSKKIYFFSAGQKF